MCAFNWVDSIILPFVSALVGSGVTILATFFTIKAENNKIIKIEKMKNMPLILKSSVSTVMMTGKFYSTIKTDMFPDLHYNSFNEITAPVDDRFCINSFVLKNTKIAPFLFEGILINDKFFCLRDKVDQFIEEEIFLHFIFSSMAIRLEEDIRSIYIVIRDIRRERYMVEIKFKVSIETMSFGINGDYKHKIRCLNVYDIGHAKELKDETERGAHGNKERK